MKPAEDGGIGIRLEINNVSCGYHHGTVVKDISVGLTSGEILCVLGPNGVGKTTLFKTILGFLRPQGGEILLDGENVRTWPRRRLAMVIGYVPQAHTPAFPFRVLDVVLMGRTAHIGLAASPAKADVAVAETALDVLGVSFLRDRIYTEISGGERQMVLIARALAQQPRFLVMDEPTANLAAAVVAAVLWTTVVAGCAAPGAGREPAVHSGFVRPDAR